MFGELPKLLDRNFVVGFFLPAAVLAGLCWMVLADFGFAASPWTRLSQVDNLLATSLAVGCVWLLATGLAALNRPFVRLLEGYPLRRFAPLRRVSTRRFEREAELVLRVQADIEEARARGTKEPQKIENHDERLRNAVMSFPDKKVWVLPTGFGNVYRSFEVYPRVVYGLDAIPAWPRLQAVMPDSFRARLTEAESQLMFGVNLIYAGILAVLLWIVLAVWSRTVPGLIVPSSAILLAVLARVFAGSALHGFGEYVKAAFDLYRGDLAKHMGLELPRSIEEEREMWSAASRMMIFRSPYSAVQLARFRPQKSTEEQKTTAAVKS